MRNLKRFIVFLLLLLTITLPSTTAQAKLRLNSKTGLINLHIGKTFKLKVKGNKKKLKVKWSSENKGIATVNKRGVVRARRPGITKIWAKVGKTRLYCAVGVPEERPVQAMPQPTPMPVPTPTPTPTPLPTPTYPEIDDGLISEY